MRKLALAMIMLCCFSGAAFAGEKIVCDDFSLELPDGWKTTLGPNKHSFGSIAIFGGAQHGDIVTVNITSTTGLDIAGLINTAKQKAKQKKQSISIISSDQNGYVAEVDNGNLRLRTIVSADTENKRMGIVGYTSGSAAAEAVAKTVKAKDPKLVFFR